MFMYFLVILIFCYQNQGYASAQSETTQCHSKSPDEIVKKVLGEATIYHVNQQIFYYTCNDQKTKPDDDVVTPRARMHKLHNENVVWNDARKTCIEEGGHLAVINSDSEEKILLNMLRDQKIHSAWLGLHDQFKEGNWVTINDVPLKNTGYTKWAGPHIPDNSGGNENCAILYHLGGIDDQKCDKKFSFVCEIPA